MADIDHVDTKNHWLIPISRF